MTDCGLDTVDIGFGILFLFFFHCGFCCFIVEVIAYKSVQSGEMQPKSLADSKHKHEVVEAFSSIHSTQ